MNLQQDDQIYELKFQISEKQTQLEQVVEDWRREQNAAVAMVAEMQRKEDLIEKLKRELNILCETTNRRNDFYYTVMNIVKKFCRTRLGKDPLIKIESVFN